ncbi:proteasome regulatory particle lid subunit RPN3 [Aspergillus vadensis CBS 113365]|uniref:Terpenoid synthase n=1 Tax=Aspergillus vadensis (strain CBS 113365 / IMI 142717 / IBT 24658) TaxID=1448311 RepID=A0A319AW82_ASPVC|nr:terpenoid synthase [Aspergillus vadensis CBS 113365]PYH63854.1 terpenoid synthase [Aspergillus vadensis CBS 113365]
MPAERRSLRSNSKSDTSSSANGEKGRSTSQSSSSNKDKPAPTRAAANKAKAASTTKGASSNNTANSGMGEQRDQPRANGSDPTENGVNGSEDVEMGEDTAGGPTSSFNASQDRKGDEKMTVVVPPTKGSRLSGEKGTDKEGDVAMEGAEGEDAEPEVDPKTKAIQDIKTNFTLLERAVTHFDPRFTLRVLRSISSMRKHITGDVLAEVIEETYSSSSVTASFLLNALDQAGALGGARSSAKMEIESEKTKSAPKETLPEVDIYMSILVQIFLYDKKEIQLGAKFSANLIERLRTLNRRTLDSLAARVYFYYSLFYEQIAPLPPSPAATVTKIRQPLLAALRTAVLRKDVDTQATVMTLLLRNYLSTSHISQADLLISHNKFPPSASNNQIARYLYYLGRIRAIQLQYTDAHGHLIGATRKSPSSHSARGFYQASHKLLVVVELLMGDIPDRAIFRQPALERAMHPYFLLVQAVSVGDLDGFLNIVNTHSATFRKDGTYTLILRLRQNVIKTGIRMMSLSYSRISLRDICLRLGLDSEESAEYIVAKAIRDGVIEASLDHEHGFMKSKEVGDIYATREPGEVFHERIRACLSLHDESVKAMRFPMNQHRLELKSAQEARERERELAKEIQEGDMDDEDAGGDFDAIYILFDSILATFLTHPPKMKARTVPASGLVLSSRVTSPTIVCWQCLRNELVANQFQLQSRKYHPTKRNNVSPFGAAVSAAQTIFKGLPKAPPGISVDPLRMVGKELKFLTKNLRQLLGSGHPTLDKVAKYYTRSEGKHMRPLLVLLMSQATALCPRKAGTDNNSATVNDPISSPSILVDKNPDLDVLSSGSADAPYDFAGDKDILPTQRRLAEITELIHTASLLHDDVIDNAESRRSLTSANLQFGNKMAVLAGDFMLGRASVALARLRDPEVIELMSTVITNLVEGEFMQLKNTAADEKNPVFTDDTLSYYLQKTYLKTGSLISKSCRSTAVLGHSAPEVVEASYQYGRNLGLAFQLVDDMLDYTVTEAELGKPAGADLELGLATAPLLFAWKQFPELGPLVGRKFSQPGDVQKARELVFKADGVEQTRILAQEYADKAVAAISDFPDSDAKAGLAQMCEKTMKRRK